MDTETKDNFGKIMGLCIAAYVAVVASLIIAIAAIVVNRKPVSNISNVSNSSNVAPSNSPDSSAPSLKLAESVCYKHDGEIVDYEDARFGGVLPSTGTEGFSAHEICERYTRQNVSRNNYPNAYNMDGTPVSDEELQYMYGTTVTSTDFSYEIGILDDDQKVEYWNSLREELTGYGGHEDVSAYTILEDSDDMFKACNSMAGLIAMCIGVYDNAAVGIMSGGDFTVIDDLFAELGFPNRNRLDDYVDNIRNSTK